MRWILLALVLAGCAHPDRTVPPPLGTEWATCPPTSSRGIAVPFRAFATNDTGGLPFGIHRLGERSFLFVWANESDTLREDRITRVNPVEVARDARGVVHVCTRVDVATPTEVDGRARALTIGARFDAQDALPAGPLQVTVNWVAGCPCDPLPMGNVTASFEG